MSDQALMIPANGMKTYEEWVAAFEDGYGVETIKREDRDVLLRHGLTFKDEIDSTTAMGIWGWAVIGARDEGSRE